MPPEISEVAWALLGFVHSAERCGTAPPRGFGEAYIELQAHGLVAAGANGQLKVTPKGDAALRERYRAT